MEEVSEKKKIKYGNQEFDSDLVAAGLARNAQAYIDSLNLNRKDAARVYSSVLDMISRIESGDIDSMQYSGQAHSNTDFTNNPIDKHFLGIKTGKGIDANGVAADFMWKYLLGAESKLNSTSNSTIKTKYTNTGLDLAFFNLYFGGNAPDATSLNTVWLSLDNTDSTGKRSRNARLTAYANLLDDYINNEVLNTYDYTGSAFKNADDYKAKLKVAADAARQGNFDAFLRAYAAAGGNMTNLNAMFTDGSVSSSSLKSPVDLAWEQALLSIPPGTSQEEIAKMKELFYKQKADEQFLSYYANDYENRYLQWGNTHYQIDAPDEIMHELGTVPYKEHSVDGNKNANNDDYVYWFGKGKMDEGDIQDGFFASNENQAYALNLLKLVISGNFNGNIKEPKSNKSNKDILRAYMLGLQMSNRLADANTFTKVDDNVYFLNDSFDINAGTGITYDYGTNRFTKVHVSDNSPILKQALRNIWMKQNPYLHNTSVQAGRWRDGGKLKKLRSLKLGDNLNFAKDLKEAHDAERELAYLNEAKARNIDVERVKQDHLNLGHASDSEDKSARGTTADYIRLATVLTDIASVGAAYTGAGIPAAAALQIGSFAGDLTADIIDPTKSWGEVIGNGAINLGLGLAVTTGVGAAAKFRKIGKTISASIPLIMTAIAGTSLADDPGFKVTMDKIQENTVGKGSLKLLWNTWTTQDLKNLNALIKVVTGGHNSAKTSASVLGEAWGNQSKIMNGLGRWGNSTIFTNKTNAVNTAKNQQALRDLIDTHGKTITLADFDDTNLLLKNLKLDKTTYNTLKDAVKTAGTSDPQVALNNAFKNMKSGQFKMSASQSNLVEYELAKANNSIQPVYVMEDNGDGTVNYGGFKVKKETALEMRKEFNSKATKAGLTKDLQNQLMFDAFKKTKEGQEWVTNWLNSHKEVPAVSEFIADKFTTLSKADLDTALTLKDGKIGNIEIDETKPYTINGNSVKGSDNIKTTLMSIYEKAIADATTEATNAGRAIPAADVLNKIGLEAVNKATAAAFNVKGSAGTPAQAPVNPFTFDFTNNGSTFSVSRFLNRAPEVESTEPGRISKLYRTINPKMGNRFDPSDPVGSRNLALVEQLRLLRSDSSAANLGLSSPTEFINGMGLLRTDLDEAISINRGSTELASKLKGAQEKYQLAVDKRNAAIKVLNDDFMDTAKRTAAQNQLAIAESELKTATNELINVNTAIKNTLAAPDNKLVVNSTLRDLQEKIQNTPFIGKTKIESKSVTLPGTTVAVEKPVVTLSDVGNKQKLDATLILLGINPTDIGTALTDAEATLYGFTKGYTTPEGLVIGWKKQGGKILSKVNPLSQLKKGGIVKAVSGIKFSNNTGSWKHEIFDDYANDIIEFLTKNPNKLDWYNDMLSRHAKMYKAAGNNFLEIAFGGPVDNDSEYISRYQNDYDNYDQAGYNTRVPYNTIQKALNRGRYVIDGKRYTGDGSKDGYKNDNFYSAITDDRRLLGRLGDWDENSDEFKSWKDRLNKIGIDFYLDKDNYYKLRRIPKDDSSDTETLSDNELSRILVGVLSDIKAGIDGSIVIPTSLSNSKNIPLQSILKSLKNGTHPLELANLLIANKEAEDVYNLSKKIKPVLDRFTPITSLITGDLGSLLNYQRIGNEITSKAERLANNTANYNDAAAIELEGENNRAKQDAQGRLVDNAEIRRTDEIKRNYRDYNIKGYDALYNKNNGALISDANQKVVDEMSKVHDIAANNMLFNAKLIYDDLTNRQNNINAEIEALSLAMERSRKTALEEYIHRLRSISNTSSTEYKQAYNDYIAAADQWEKTKGKEFMDKIYQAKGIRIIPTERSLAMDYRDIVPSSKKGSKLKLLTELKSGDKISDDGPVRTRHKDAERFHKRNKLVNESNHKHLDRVGRLKELYAKKANG